MTIFAVKGDAPIFQLIFGLIVMNIVEHIFKAVPVLWGVLCQYVVNKTNKVIPISKSAPDITSRITMSKNYEQKGDDTITDAVIDYICKQDCAEDLYFDHFYLISKEGVIKVNNDINMKITTKTFKNNALQHIQFELYSTTLTLTGLKKWVDKINRDYEINKKNRFGDKRFFFDEIIQKINMGMNGPPNLFFNMTEFATNKSLKNIYGPDMEVVRARVDLFVNHPEWYEQKGIPHTLGFLLHGPPGTGKTSLIKAIAKDTRRHIFNIKLRPTTTPEQLLHLFYNENVNVRVGQNYQQVIIPLDQRIYVMEDIDCLSHVVLDRKIQDEMKTVIDSVIPADDDMMVNTFGKSEVKRKKNNEEDIQLSLNFLLNLFDGILETPGRILIMTSNYPEKLDKALIRPGRVDIKLNLTYCTAHMINEMFTGFYGRDYGFDFSAIHSKLTPAQVQEYLCYHISQPEKACEELLEKYRHAKVLTWDGDTKIEETKLEETKIEEAKEVAAKVTKL